MSRRTSRCRPSLPSRSSRRCRRRWASAQLLNELGRGNSDFVKRIVTTSPDVTVSTNLGPWVNRRNLFAREKMADTFKSERIASTFNWEFSPTGQHIELGIAENNLFIALSALGLSHSINGERLFPIGTLYDPFIARGLDALELRLLSGGALHSGGDAVRHHARGRRRRAPVDRHAADRHGAGRARGVRAGLRRRARRHHGVVVRLHPEGRRRPSRPSATGCATRPAARSICGSPRARSSRSSARSTPSCAQAIIDGAYWMRKPGPNCQVVVAYTGAVAPEAIEAIGLMARGPPRRRAARRHVSRPAQCRLDRRAARARARARAMRARISSG